MKTLVYAAFGVLLAVSGAFAQDVQVSRENKTVAVTTAETLELEPEYGIVKLGFHNYAASQDIAYEDNGRLAAKIIKALLGAGVKKEDIETEAIQLGRVEEDYTSTPRQRSKEQQFQAQQTWNISVPVNEVQKVVDIAVLAGANDVQEVVWAVKDPDSVERKLRAAAIARARSEGEEMAQGLGVKLGALLYVTNSDANHTYYGVFGANKRHRGALTTVEVSAQRLPILNLYPQKVRQEVTVYAVFALE
jgi:uncharacterized protein